MLKIKFKILLFFLTIKKKRKLLNSTNPIFKKKSSYTDYKFNIKQSTWLKSTYYKKERYYTKLKYSRVPQFDVTSGAIASLMGALLGFMITEKFGLELLDSGDFFFVFIYILFMISIIRLYWRMVNLSDSKYYIFSPMYVYNYFNSIFFIINNYWKVLKYTVLKLFKL